MCLWGLGSPFCACAGSGCKTFWTCFWDCCPRREHLQPQRLAIVSCGKEQVTFTGISQRPVNTCVQTGEGCLLYNLEEHRMQAVYKNLVSVLNTSNLVRSVLNVQKAVLLIAVACVQHLAKSRTLSGKSPGP